MAEKGWLDCIFCQNRSSKVKDMENGDVPKEKQFFEGLICLKFITYFNFFSALFRREGYKRKHDRIYKRNEENWFNR